MERDYAERRAERLRDLDGLRAEIDVENRIGHVILDRPPLNIVSYRARGQIRALLEEMDEDDDIGVICVRGANGVFTSGGDVKSFPSIPKNRMSDLADDIGTPERCRKPVIAALEKFASESGFEWRSLAISGPHVGLMVVAREAIGQMPGSGGSVRWRIARSPWTGMLGKRIPAEQAVDCLSRDRRRRRRGDRAVHDYAARFNARAPISMRRSAVSTAPTTPASRSPRRRGHSYEKIRTRALSGGGITDFAERCETVLLAVGRPARSCPARMKPALALGFESPARTPGDSTDAAGPERRGRSSVGRRGPWVEVRPRARRRRGLGVGEAGLLSSRRIAVAELRVRMRFDRQCFRRAPEADLRRFVLNPWHVAGSACVQKSRCIANPSNRLVGVSGFEPPAPASRRRGQAVCSRHVSCLSTVSFTFGAFRMAGFIAGAKKLCPGCIASGALRRWSGLGGERQVASSLVHREAEENRRRSIVHAVPLTPMVIAVCLKSWRVAWSMPASARAVDACPLAAARRAGRRFRRPSRALAVPRRRRCANSFCGPARAAGVFFVSACPAPRGRSGPVGVHMAASGVRHEPKAHDRT